MKWRTTKVRAFEGDTRAVRKFAFLPKECGTFTVWLETYDSIQEYKAMTQFADGLIAIKCLEWVEIDRQWLELYP